MMNKDNRNDKIRKIAKKGLTFSLCAVLAGGLAAGSFEGVNKLAGWSGATTVEAASNKDETTLTYAKSEKKDADASDSKSDTGKDTGSTAKGSLDVSEIVSEALASIVSITTKSVQEYASSLDQIGPVGKDVSDCAALLEIIAGHDTKDSTSMKREDLQFSKELTGDIKGMKFGVPEE